MNRERLLEEAAQEAAQALLKGDWTGYQRCLRGIPAEGEAELLKRIDAILHSTARVKTQSQKQRR